MCSVTWGYDGAAIVRLRVVHVNDWIGLGMSRCIPATPELGCINSERRQSGAGSLRYRVHPTNYIAQGVGAIRALGVGLLLTAT